MTWSSPAVSGWDGVSCSNGSKLKKVSFPSSAAKITKTSQRNFTHLKKNSLNTAKGVFFFPRLQGFCWFLTNSVHSENACMRGTAAVSGW